MTAARCADQAAQHGSDQIVRRDSSGIHITEVPQSLLDKLPRFALAQTPDLRIGAVEGAQEYLFAGAAYTATLADGSIVLINMSSHSIRFYSLEGRFLHEAGGDGEGPGEYRSLEGLSKIPGDSILVWDSRLRRVTLLNQSGRVMAIRQVHARGLNERFVGTLRDGTVILHWLWRTLGGDGSSNRDVLVRIPPGSSMPDTILAVPVAMKQVMAFGRMSWERPEFAPRTISAVGPTRVWWTSGGPWEVTHLDSAGGAVGILRFALPRRAVQSGFFKWYADSVAYKGPWPAEEKPEIRRLMDRRGAADSFPAFDAIRVGADERLWLRSYQFPGESQDWTWLVVEADGSPVAWTVVRRSFTPYEFGADYLLGIGRDSLNVQYVERYRLVKAGS